MLLLPLTHPLGLCDLGFPGLPPTLRPNVWGSLTFSFYRKPLWSESYPHAIPCAFMGIHEALWEHHSISHWVPITFYAAHIDPHQCMWPSERSMRAPLEFHHALCGPRECPWWPIGAQEGSLSFCKTFWGHSWAWARPAPKFVVLLSLGLCRSNPCGASSGCPGRS